MEYREIDSRVQSTISGSFYTKHITLADMRVPMNHNYDTGGSPVMQHVSLADESFPGSGGGSINVMGSELAWSARQRYQMISRTSDPRIPPTSTAEVLRTPDRWSSYGKPAPVLEAFNGIDMFRTRSTGVPTWPSPQLQPITWSTTNRTVST